MLLFLLIWNFRDNLQNFLSLSKINMWKKYILQTLITHCKSFFACSMIFIKLSFIMIFTKIFNHGKQLQNLSGKAAVLCLLKVILRVEPWLKVVFLLFLIYFFYFLIADTEPPATFQMNLFVYGFCFPPISIAITMRGLNFLIWQKKFSRMPDVLHYLI